MQKLQCELCGSVDFQRTDDGFFQCQHCGCKYTLEQAKTILGGTVETTIGNAELNRRVENARTQMRLGQPAGETINSIIKDFPGSWQGYWLYVESAFKSIFDASWFHELPRFTKEHYETLLKIAKESSEITEKQVKDLWEGSFRRIHDEMISGKMEFFPFHLNWYPELKPILDEGVELAKSLSENGIFIIKRTDHPSDFLYYFGKYNGVNVRQNLNYARGTILYQYDEGYVSVEYQGIPITRENMPQIIRTARNNSLRLITMEKKCPRCFNSISKNLFGSGYKCKRCNTVFDL